MRYEPTFLKTPSTWKKRKAYDRAYYDLRKEKIKARRRARYLENQETIKEARRNRYHTLEKRQKIFSPPNGHTLPLDPGPLAGSFDPAKVPPPIAPGARSRPVLKQTPASRAQVGFK